MSCYNENCYKVASKVAFNDILCASDCCFQTKVIQTKNKICTFYSRFIHRILLQAPFGSLRIIAPRATKSFMSSSHQLKKIHIKDCVSTGVILWQHSIRCCRSRIEPRIFCAEALSMALNV